MRQKNKRLSIGSENLVHPITDVAMTGSNKKLFQVVSGAVAQNASGQVNVKFGAVNNVPSYGKYRVPLYMQSQDQFY